MDLEQFFQLLSEDRLSVFVFPIYILAIVVERLIDKREGRGLYKGKDSVTSFWILLLTIIVEFFPKLLALIAFFYLHEISPLKEVVGRQWWAWIILFFLDDFAYYWFHRTCHEIRIFWAGHVTHHSSEHYHFVTALRQGVGERVHKFLFWMWIPLLGFDPIMIFTIVAVNLFYQFWVHTELVDKLPRWYEFVFNTPSHHRVHHASNVRYLDCNHGGVFILWDRLFGTFSEEKDFERPVYGLTTNIRTFNPLKVATHEYSAILKDVKRAKKWSDKLKYIFYAPGWSHNGEDKRAKTLRKKIGL